VDSSTKSGVEMAKGPASSTVDDWPEQKFILYSEANCRGRAHTVHNTHIEQKCTKCFDTCAKKFADSTPIQGNIASVQVFGEHSVVSLWAVCKGTWRYPEGEGFLTTVFPTDGCHNININWPPVHFEFHLQSKLEIAKKLNVKKQGNPYEKNPIKDPQQVMNKIAYYSSAAVPNHPRGDPNKYITFLKDCGGFNNIRMGFEHAILMAWVTKRTLVLPPPEGWYLIDFGPIKRGGSYSKGQTDFKEYFDMEHMMKGISVLTAKEFYEKEKSRLSLPDKFGGDALTRKNDEWKAYLFNNFGGQAWTPLKNVILDPSVQEYMRNPHGNKKDDLMKGKRPIDFGQDLLSKTVIHFPSCHGPHGDQGDYRFLGQISNAVLFADRTKEIEFKRFWKNFIHYPPQVFEAASHMIARMGLFSYTAIHIRRNDLQYKEVFQNAQATLRNIDAFLYPGETLYVATDETNDGFFDALREKHKVYQWKDVVDAAKGIQYSEKVINIIEQTICTGGRLFFGTQKSTFSSYIFRMRGYVGAPDTNEYWHNIHYTGIDYVDKFAQPKVTGSNYMMEDPGMWKDLE